MLVPAWARHWQGRGRVRFVGAVSSGMAIPHTPECAASWSTDKLITHLEGPQNSKAAEIRTGKSIRQLMPSSLAQKSQPQAVLSLFVLKIPPQSRLCSLSQLLTTYFIAQKHFLMANPNFPGHNSSWLSFSSYLLHMKKIYPAISTAQSSWHMWLAQHSMAGDDPCCCWWSHQLWDLAPADLGQREQPHALFRAAGNTLQHGKERERERHVQSSR